MFDIIIIIVAVIYSIVTLFDENLPVKETQISQRASAVIFFGQREEYPHM